MSNFVNVSQSLGFRIAFSVYRDLVGNTSSVGYIMLGRNTPWAANDTVPEIYDTENAKFDAYNNFLGGKKITGNDAFLVVPRVNWTPNVVWTQYDDASNTQFSSGNSMFVYTSNGNVYKCLNNANGSYSTVEPVNNYSSDNGFIAPGDGYLWKYMYKVPSDSKYLTDSWMPAPLSQTPAYFGDANNIVVGAISRLEIANAGTGYSNTNTSIVISGSGISGNASVVVSNGSISSVTLTDRGARYIRQNTQVRIIGSGTSANVRPILSPWGGHGFNPARELGANTIMIAVKVGDVDSSENGNISANNDFRQVGLVMRPHLYGANTEVSSANANVSVTMATHIVLVSGTAFIKDELVYQGASSNSASFSGYVSDTFPSAIEVTGRQGTPAPGRPIIGVTSGISRTVVSYSDPDFDVESGNLVYIENRAPVMRSLGQGEWIKIILKF
jgi:hypothetical protein